MKSRNRITYMFSVITFAIALVLGTKVMAAETPLEINWGDLIPESAKLSQKASPLGTVQHGQLTTPLADAPAANTTSEYDGKTVRIPGYVVPLEFNEGKIKQFLLVPYVGACIHVPAPPANQLIIVTSEEPHELKGLFEPVYVTGMFGAAAQSTQLADVGYAISAEKIEPYE
ncbi:MAG: DUF3299 domain-containing protein [Rhizobiaceae bacterium]